MLPKHPKHPTQSSHTRVHQRTASQHSLNSNSSKSTVSSQEKDKPKESKSGTQNLYHYLSTLKPEQKAKRKQERLEMQRKKELANQQQHQEHKQEPNKDQEQKQDQQASATLEILKKEHESLKKIYYSLKAELKDEMKKNRVTLFPYLPFLEKTDDVITQQYNDIWLVKAEIIRLVEFARNYIDPDFEKSRPELDAIYQQADQLYLQLKVQAIAKQVDYESTVRNKQKAM